MKHQNKDPKVIKAEMTKWTLTGPRELDLTKRQPAIEQIQQFFEDKSEPGDHVDMFVEFWNNIPDDGKSSEGKSYAVPEYYEDWLVDADRIGLLNIFECKLVE